MSAAAKRTRAKPKRDEKTEDMFGYEGMTFGMPEAGTLTHALGRLLLMGQAHTAPSFYAMAGSMRLAAYIRELRELGWPMAARVFVAVATERPTKRFARHKLAQSAIQPLREAWREAFGTEPGCAQ